MILSRLWFLPFAAATLASLPASAEWRWERLDKPSPPSMYGHSMVYDSGRNRLVVYGGTRWYTESYGNNHYPYVWEWDGETWYQASDSTLPANFSRTAMAYDSRRGVTVLFGGSPQGGGSEDRTFEWNGSNWSEVFTRLRPSGRAGHAMAYDSRRGVTVLFGGSFADTWEFDGRSWRQVATTGPSARYFAPMAYDQARGKIVLHGGSSGWIGSPVFSDTWEWDGVVWNRIVPATPGPARSFHTLTYDSRRKITVLVGGGGPSLVVDPKNDTWEYNGHTWRRSLAGQEIYARHNHAAAYHAGLGRVVVFGGLNYPRRYSDLWLFDGKSWVNDDPAPPAHSRPTMVYDRRRGDIVQFGGSVTGLIESHSDMQADTWIFETGSGWRKAKPATNPPPRTNAAMVYDAARGEVLMFGGYVVGRNGHTTWTPLRDMWIWNGSTWRVVNRTGPWPHSSGPMFYDIRLKKTVLVSYKSGSQIIRVVWLWDGRSWTETTIQPPYSATTQHELVYDPIGMQGLARFWRNNETWLWNGSNWKFAYSDTGRDRAGGSFTFDESANRAFYYGGGDESSTLSDALFWDGSVWHDLGHQPPGPRTGAGAAYDPVLGRSVIFGGLAVVYGGIDVEFYDDTWAVRWVP